MGKTGRCLGLDLKYFNPPPNFEGYKKQLTKLLKPHGVHYSSAFGHVQNFLEKQLPFPPFKVTVLGSSPLIPRLM